MKRWRGPEYPGEFPTLGLQLLEWSAEVLPSPRDPDSPLVLTDEQAQIFIEWYELDPVTGRFVDRRGVIKRAKGWGKSPLSAIDAIAQLCAEVRFDGWDAKGEPVGRPWGTAGDPNAWVQLAAVSEDQTDNTSSVVHDLLTLNDGAAADLLHLDPGLTRTWLRDGQRRGRLEPVTASAGTREGQPITAAVMDQTESWTVRNGGVKLAGVLRRNVAKMGGRTLETPNAFRPGEESVAERSQRAAQSGAPGIYYHMVEAPPVDLDALLAPDYDHELADREIHDALVVAYGDAVLDPTREGRNPGWVDIPRLVAEVRDPDVPREDAERFYFNWDRAGGSKAVDSRRWDELVDRDRVVERGERVGLGFDGSLSRDSTALIGCTEDGHVFVPTVDGVPTVWVRPVNAGPDWKIPRLAVEAAVAWCMDYYRVGRMYGDPPRWQTEIERWSELFGDEVVLMFDTNQPKRMSGACDRWDTAIGKRGDPDRSITHDGDTLLRSHVLAMVRRRAYVKDADETDLRTRYVFDKGPEGHKIDAGIASVLAYEAAATMPEVKEVPPPNIF